MRFVKFVVKKLPQISTNFHKFSQIIQQRKIGTPVEKLDVRIIPAKPPDFHPASFFKAPETLEAPETPETLEAPETPETPETPVEKHDFKELGAKIMVRWLCVNAKRVKWVFLTQIIRIFFVSRIDAEKEKCHLVGDTYSF